MVIQMKTGEKGDRQYSRFLAIVGVMLVIAIFCASAGLVRARQERIQRQSGELKEAVARGPHVLVMRLKFDAGSRAVDLPASIHGYIETPVYAKIPGYLKQI